MTLIERVRCMLFEVRLPKHFWGEALYTIVHVINLSPIVALNTKVLNKIWFGKDVMYDHLRVFDCKTFVHVPKDERSKFDMKIRCIFIGYGHDEHGYKLYNPVEKKLVKSHDVQFMKDQTIKDIDKVNKSTPEKDNNLFEIYPFRILVHNLDTVDNNVQNGEQHNYVGDQQLGDDFDIPLDDDAEEEQEMSQDENLGDAPEPPPGAIHLGKNSTFHYRFKHIDVRYHWIRDALDAKLLELVKVHIDDNGAGMMTKRVPRGKFKACCEIAELTITST
ncbi:hypothetical protein CR513_06043, partial [Mucuna pruriens]